MHHPRDYREDTYFEKLPIELLEEIHNYTCPYVADVRRLDPKLLAVIVETADTVTRMFFFQNTNKESLVYFLRQVEIYQRDRDQATMKVSFDPIHLRYEEGMLCYGIAMLGTIHYTGAVVVYRSLMDALYKLVSML